MSAGSVAALAAAAAVAIAAGPAAAQRMPPNGPSGSCKPSWTGKPAQYGHAFIAHVTKNPCHIRVEGALLCFVNVTNPDPPGSSGASTYWVYGRGTHHEKASRVVCPYGPPFVQSSVVKYGVRYEFLGDWHYSVKRLS